jgi:N6-L-threonylcarbamoyladenine synthase
MRILGIETSCDDTAAAVVVDAKHVAANVSTNQDAFHARYGGIVPEIASRRHLDLLSAVIEHALSEAKIGFAELDGIAVTAGPGLIGSLLVGVAFAKAMAYALSLPLYAVNHLHGHIFAPFLESRHEPQYPFLTLLVSGGHSQLVEVRSPIDFTILGRTHDDAAGEAFDKTARLLGLPFPGGPALDALARKGNAKAVAFPRNRAEGNALDLSFSGLKTAARRYIESPAGQICSREDIAASFEAAVVDVLIDRVDRAARRVEYHCVVLSGGVAANTGLQVALKAWSKKCSVPVLIPPLRFCTDNAAMIAAVAERQADYVLADPFTLVADPQLPFVLPTI